MNEQTMGVFGYIIILAIAIFYYYCMWRIFEKAKRPGWEAIIPLYNIYILITKIAKKEAWWIILFFIPLVNFIAAIIIYLEIAKNFGKSTAFGIGLVFLSFIFIPILAFDDSKFQGDGMELEDSLIA